MNNTKNVLSLNTRLLWHNFLRQFPKINLFTVDPGAYAVAEILKPMIIDIGNYGGWFAEGWSAMFNSELRGMRELLNELTADQALIIGSQVCYTQTHELIRLAKQKRAYSIFVFDHWKNYGQHFCPDLMPDKIIVPDLKGKYDLLSSIGKNYSERVDVLPHVSIEAGATRIKKMKCRKPGTIAFLLDPTVQSDDLGYDWQSVLLLLPSVVERYAPNSKILIKPHPRQNHHEIINFIQLLKTEKNNYNITELDTEILIACVDEVWGMTTIALITALKADKQIRSIQIGRNLKGIAASNYLIEPFLVELV